MKHRRPTIDFCVDDDLGYERSRTRFAPGAGLALDDAYRLAHLPLVAPDHPRVIATREGTPYEMGRHAQVFSLVLPIPGEALRRSVAFLQLESALRASPFAGKIAWNLWDRRQDKLHATLCGSLSVGAETPPKFDERQLGELRRLGPIGVELRGVFSGTVNIGRLYLRVYPECRSGANLFRHIQRVLGRRETDLYLVGVYNFTDDLDPVEATALDSLIRQWWDRPLLRFEADHLWLLGATDDLVLNGGVTAIVPLSDG
ncbi:MAG TPA: hypothetical protein VNT30_10940 [Stellaceae bacterium]|nr:hypothetical protein [Stellaceae bacterium]